METTLKPKLKPSQMRMIHVLKAQNGFSNDKLHDLVNDWVGVASLRDLTPSQAYEVTQKLEACRNVSKIKTPLEIVTKKFKSKYILKPGGLTESQYGCIKGKQRDLGWTDSHLEGFINHTLKSKIVVEDLKVKQASAVISGLTEMEKQNSKK